MTDAEMSKMTRNVLICFRGSKLMEKRIHIHRRPKGGECIDYDLNKLQRCIMFNGELWDICEYRVARYGSKLFVAYVLR
jgi:hypothetical protein